MSFNSLRKTLVIGALLPIFLGACSDELDPPPPENEVTSINVFFSKEDVSGEIVGKAYSYAAETGIINELATINTDDDSVAVLDTDEDAPGYEFAAYAEGRTVKLIDYAKTATQRIYTLQEFSSDICGLYPVKKPADSVFDTDSEYFRKTLDDTAVYVAVMNGSSCSRATDSYQLLDFRVPSGVPLTESRSVTSADVFGTFLIDTGFRFTPEDGELITGRSIWISHNRDNETLRGKVYQGDILFEVPFAYKDANKPDTTPETPPPLVTGLDFESVLIQKHVKTYDGGGVETGSETQLFELTLTDFNNLLEIQDTASSSNAIAIYFDTPFDVVSRADLSEPVDYTYDDAYLVYEGELDVFRYPLRSFQPKSVFTKELSLLSLEMDLLIGGNLVVKKAFSGFESLTYYAQSGPTEPQILIPSALSIEAHTEGSTIYLNALAPTSILTEPVTTTSWVLAQLRDDRIERILTDAALVFAPGAPPEDTVEFLILTATEEPVGTAMRNPNVSKYDGSESTGIFIEREFSEDESEILSFTERTLGRVTGNVESFSNEITGANFQANNDYGTIQLKTSSATLGYYFFPTQLDAESSDRLPSFALLRSISGDNPITTNILTLNED